MLIKYVKNNNLDEIKKLILNGANVNVVNYLGDTALIWASMEGHKEIVNLLIENGADVNIADKYGDTALICASIEGYTEVVKILVENGADVNVVNEDGKTALIWASVKGRTEVVNLLLKNGADINVVDEHGKTALDYAIKHGYKEIVNLLLKNGASKVQQELSAIRSIKNEAYGSASVSFGSIARFWNAYLHENLRKKLTKTDVACMMALFKISRHNTGRNHLDNFVDGANYLILGGDLLEDND